MRIGLLEVCCGEYQDALAASEAGVTRIELNSALFLGGLTPTLGSLRLIKQNTDLKVICMVRPRGAGFYYSDSEFQEIQASAKLLLQNGADGLAFGFLTAESKIDLGKTEELVELVHEYGKEAVFHRAFDCALSPISDVQKLIDLKIDRLLTSGLHAAAFDGRAQLKELQEKYGQQIEILAGSGINPNNVQQILIETGVTQIHASCTEIIYDQTAQGNQVDFSYLPAYATGGYERVSKAKVEQLLSAMIIRY
ncbi:CutC family protein [Liquorilactobacillus aquaticus DSM 21051]|uniref:PF03932 family protein CutC n=1 Tax=Liquorilactobacillus aquaticus DSM 21051 TaxID=1423725 RepID=A0A0R2CUC6_9LACO|nr:copper homeostasis protein CutC [Liquorilactobacillus aquaticus]KRM95391.1 CutC family protein [Liquorilactobacillus aquaticus DSM 21051]